MSANRSSEISMVADKVALFSFGFALGMTTALGLGVHAGREAAREVTAGIERAATNALMQAQTFLEKFAQQQHRSGTRSSTDDMPSTEVKIINGETGLSESVLTMLSTVLGPCQRPHDAPQFRHRCSLRVPRSKPHL